MHKRAIITTFLLYLKIITFSECARILGVVPSASFSHQLVFRPIWKGLAERGHDVVVITTNPENDPDLKIKEIDISFAYKLWNEKHKFMKKFEDFQNSPYQLINMIREVTLDLCNEELMYPEVQAILKNETEHFDLVILEYLYPVMFGFAERFKCPFIGVTPFDLPNILYTDQGISVHPVAYPDVFLPFHGGQMVFWERLMSTLFNFLMKINIYINGYHQEEKIMWRHFGENLPHLDQIVKKCSMIFLNSNPAFNIRPLGPSFVNIGDGIHITPLRPLPKELKTFIENSKNGVIYFSFGTNVKSDRVPLSMRKTFISAFRELPYDVLWKFDNTNLSDVPTNVKIVEWVPQQDVLRNTKVKLFITQGGLQSIEEAILSNVPLIGIPFIADQVSNIKKIVQSGVGVYLNKNEITKPKLKELINMVIKNPKYVNRMKEVARLTKDQPMTGIEKAVWWTEYVIRNKGAVHFKNPFIEMPTYQAYLLDVLGFILITFTVSVYFIYMLVKQMKKLCNICFTSSNAKLKVF